MRKTLLEGIHADMDAMLIAKTDQLHGCLKRHDMDKLWDMLSGIFEHTILHNLYNRSEDYAKLKGRGKVKISEVGMNAMGSKEHDSEAHLSTKKEKFANEILKQARRCEEVERKIRLLQCDNDAVSYTHLTLPTILLV